MNLHVIFFSILISSTEIKIKSTMKCESKYACVFFFFSFFILISSTDGQSTFLEGYLISSFKTDSLFFFSGELIIVSA